MIGTLLLPITQNFTRLWPTLSLVVAYSLTLLLSDFCLKRHPHCHCVCQLGGVEGVFGGDVWLFCVQTSPALAGDLGLGVDCGGGGVGQYVLEGLINQSFLWRMRFGRHS